MIRIVALTDAGRILGLRLKSLIQEELDHKDTVFNFKPKPFAQTVQQAFIDKEVLILICATGIAVRTIAPILEGKKSDPPVLVLDEQGAFVIPLLSGHEGGANEWARQVSGLLSAQAVFTTAETYLKPIYTIGMGCERNCTEEELMQLLTQCLAEHDLHVEQLSSLNSIDIKADEKGLLSLVEKKSLRFNVWSVEELKQVSEQLINPSAYVYETVGVYGVAESAALVAAQKETGNFAELIVPKKKSQRATCAIARSYGEIC